MHSKSSKFTLKKLWLILLWVGSVNIGLAQKSFGVDVAYLTGFQDQSLSILSTPVTYHMPHGVQFALLYSNRIKETRWKFNSALGGKYLKSTGETDDQLKFSAKSFHVNAMVGTQYRVKEKLGLGLQFVIENNRDFQDITYLKANLWRYYLGAEFTFSLTPKSDLAIKYWRSLSRNQDAYLLYVPANQISVGFKYHFNEM